MYQFLNEFIFPSVHLIIIIEIVFLFKCHILAIIFKNSELASFLKLLSWLLSLKTTFSLTLLEEDYEFLTTQKTVWFFWYCANSELPFYAT